MSNIGLIAGDGELPELAIHEGLRQNHKIYLVALNKNIQNKLQNFCVKSIYLSITESQKCFDFFKNNTINRVLILGKLKKLDALSAIPKLDSLALSYFKKLKNLDDNSFHKILIQAFNEHEINLISQSEFLKNYFVKKQAFTDRQLTPEEQADLEYGIEMANKASSLGVSQTVVVKNRAVMAFEASEGTDETIKRGCKLAKSGAVIVKIPWSDQIEFFDLPVIGEKTMQVAIQNKASVLAIKAGETFVINQAQVCELARKNNIAFLAF